MTRIEAAQFIYEAVSIVEAHGGAKDTTVRLSGELWDAFHSNPKVSPYTLKTSQGINILMVRADDLHGNEIQCLTDVMKELKET